jgi:hypothetical protein
MSNLVEHAMSEKTHERLSASGSVRWMNCPRCPQMEDGLPDGPSSAAQEGTAAHELAETCLASDTQAGEHLGLKITADAGTPFAKVFEVDEEMADAVQVYLDEVRAVQGMRLVEQKMLLPWIHPHLGGTVDCTILERSNAMIHVIDYKHGYTDVNPTWNAQLMIYGLAATHGFAEEAAIVRLVIVQPRASGEPVKAWEIPLRDLRAWGAEILAPACRATDSKDAILRAGDHCYYCKAKNQCPALKDHVGLVAQTSFACPQLPRVEDLTPDQLEKVIHSLDLLQAWGKEAFAFALRQAEAGLMQFPSLKLVKKTSKRKWLDEILVSRELEKYLPDDMIWTKKLTGITEVEKQLKARALDARGVMAQITEKPDAGYDLVDRSDKRKEETPTGQLEFIGMADVFSEQ